MRIVACVEHKQYGDLDFTPLQPWQEGQVLAEALRPGFPGLLHLDCYFCKWATPPAVEGGLTLAAAGDAIVRSTDKMMVAEQVLRSAGNPTEPDYFRQQAAEQIQPSKPRRRHDTLKEEQFADGSSGTLRQKKEKNVPTSTGKGLGIAGTPKNRDRRRGQTYSRKIGGIELILQVRGDLDAFMELDEQQAGGIRAIIKSIKAETPKGA